MYFACRKLLWEKQPNVAHSQWAKQDFICGTPTNTNASCQDEEIEVGPSEVA